MAFVFSNQYDHDTEHNLVKFFRTLSEKDRRRFAAIEANKLGHGGITYIAELLGCDRATISSGLEEFLGTLYRAGRVYSQEPFHAFDCEFTDHDFPSWSTGKIVPHGIWDQERKHGHLNLGLSHDTSEFACDSFRWYWKRIGRYHYPDATSILWLCDAGGSNNCRHHSTQSNAGSSLKSLELARESYLTHLKRWSI